MNQKPKIAVIGLKGLPAFGGAATVGENIIGHLKDRYDFTVLSVASHTTIKTGYINGINQIVFKKYGKGALNTLLYYLRCLIHCFAHNYDLVHLHHAESGFITPLLRLKYKVVVTFHGVYRGIDPKFSALQNRLFRQSEKLTIKYANQVISVSKPDQDYVYQKYKKRINYVPNGINLISERGITNLSKEPEEYILFAAARIYEIKGLHLLLKAAINSNQTVKIMVVGDLDQVREYKKDILKLAEGLNVEFLGLIKSKSELYKVIRKSKFFVFPSLTEAMSMMLLEVVSLKKPVIASDIPSNKEIFSDDELLFFESDNVADLTEKLKYAIMNGNDMDLRALKAHEKVKSRYTWSAISLKYHEIYNNLVSL